MPRIAEPDPRDRQFPWVDWEIQLNKSPTGALFFGPEDFGEMTPRLFRDRARKALGHLNVSVRIHGEEVLVSLNAS